MYEHWLCGTELPPQVADQVVDDLPRVVLGPVDERRLAPPQYWQPDGVEAGGVRHDAADVPQPALASSTGTSSQR